jgi:hypothetical protein
VANKILVARGTKARIEEIKSTLTVNELVYSTDTGELGVKKANGNIEYFMNAVDIDIKLVGKANTTHTHTKSQISDFAHNHDDRYYTEGEMDTLLNAKLNSSLKGSVNGLAELGADGKVPSSQLPSYVDDVLEYTSFSNFPSTGESSKIYISQDTNKTYRWGGSGYIEISASLALGETSSTAGRGDWTKTAYDHTLLTNNPHGVTATQIGAEPAFSKNTAFNKNFGTTAGTVAQGNHLHTGVYEPANSNIQSHIDSTSNPHGVTKTQVGLGNVDNTSDLNKPISTATQSALNNKVDKVAGKGLSTEDYTTNEKNKLASITHGAEVNVQSDWNATSGDALILNKPVIPTNVSQLNNDSGYLTGYTETDPIFTAWNKSTGISITKSQVTDLLEATQALSGLMSATDKTRLDVLHALLEEDTENSVVDSINEVLAIFNNYPEGADLVTALAGKVDKVSGKGLSENDLTDILKSNYDTAYGWGDHAVEGYLKAITKAMVEGVLTGTITSHNHDGTYEPAFTKNTAFNKNFGTSAGTVAQGNHLHTGVYEPSNANIQAHISSTSNPHGVTKADVGLGSVQNYAIATKAQAESGTSNALYMTPLRTKELITVVVGDIESALDAILGV